MLVAGPLPAWLLACAAPCDTLQGQPPLGSRPASMQTGICSWHAWARAAVMHQRRRRRLHPCRGQQQHHVRPILSGVHATWQPMGAGVGWPGAAGSQALDCAAVHPLWNRLLDGCWTLAARQFMLRNQSPPSLPPPPLPRTLCSISGAVHAPRRQDLPHFDRRFHPVVLQVCMVCQPFQLHVL